MMMGLDFVAWMAMIVGAMFLKVGVVVFYEIFLV
jgi:hypothetical protein